MGGIPWTQWRRDLFRGRTCQGKQKLLHSCCAWDDRGTPLRGARSAQWRLRGARSDASAVRAVLSDAWRAWLPSHGGLQPLAVIATAQRLPSCADRGRLAVPVPAAVSSFL